MKNIFEKVFFCTGARNHDLLKVFDNNGIKFEFDERLASFKALGLSKISQRPVAICTTSGTAVSECVSAMLEAYYSNLPLVLISGDRPKKLHGTGSPQTINHEALTTSARRTYIEVTLEELNQIDLNKLTYPAHINVLIDDTKVHNQEVHLHTEMGAFSRFIAQYRKPLFLFSHDTTSMRPLIQEFAKRKLTFYAETLSGGRDLSFIKTEKKLIELFNQGFFDSVVRIGHTPLSKIWRLLERNPMPVFHFDSRNLSGMSYGEVLAFGPDELLTNKDFIKAIDGVLPYPVADESEWKLDELIQSLPESEVSYFKKINELLPENALVYLGNSLVIRFFELTQNKNYRVYGNRGVNGIDGQLASAIGLAMGTKEQVYCFLGDVTAFYDLSALREFPSNLHLIIMNNKGGRIFDLLNLDKRIVLEHDENFEKIIKGFNLSYANTLTEFGNVQVLELFPTKQQSERFLQEWNK